VCSSRVLSCEMLLCIVKYVDDKDEIDGVYNSQEKERKCENANEQRGNKENSTFIMPGS